MQCHLHQHAAGHQQQASAWQVLDSWDPVLWAEQLLPVMERVQVFTEHVNGCRLARDSPSIPSVTACSLRASGRSGALPVACAVRASCKN